MVNKEKKILLGILTVVLGLLVAHIYSPGNDLHNNSVMITNREQTSGGTGIILKSGPHKSEVLTNNHVCKLVAHNGGLVVTTFGTFQVNSTKPSALSDLCILTVLDNLYLNTKLASKAPKLYSDVKISGHPALMPNIISIGHLAGRDIIPVMTEIRACKDIDIQRDPLMCAFMGGIPVVKYYESVLTSATIMPGSSGSGIYNNSNKLIGVVFAGQGNFGYSWTVPYEQVKLFVEKEAPSLYENLVSQEQNVSGGQREEAKDKIKEATEKCATTKVTNQLVKKVCSILSYDMVWRK